MREVLIMKNVKVTTARLNVRKSANRDSEVLRIVNKDDVLEYTSIKNGWVRLKGAGYVMEEFVTPVEIEET
jgi:uncharacterized protein YgiM (DUF1202 family)